MRLVDALPEKLLDCVELEGTVWPASFVLLGQAARIDYTTSLHAEGEEYEAFRHIYSSGVQAYVPSMMDSGIEEESFALEEAIAPIALGFVDRLVVVTGDYVTAFVRAEIADEPEEILPPPTETVLFDVALLAWDPEGKQLVLTDMEGAVLAVVAGGLMDLDEEGMIAG